MGQKRGFQRENNTSGGNTGLVFSNPGETQPQARVEALSLQCPGKGFTLENPEYVEPDPTFSMGSDHNSRRINAIDTQGWRGWES